MQSFKRKAINIIVVVITVVCLGAQNLVFAAPVEDGSSPVESAIPGSVPNDSQIHDGVDYSLITEEEGDFGIVDPNDADVVPFIERKGIVISDSVNVRALPDTESNAVLLLGMGTEVTIKNVIEDEWYFIEKEYDDGYVRKDLIYSPEDNTEGMVNGLDINFRAEPSTDSAVIGTLKFNQNVEVVGFKDGWFNVRTEDGLDGYVVRSLVAVKGIDYINNNSVQEGDRGSVVSNIQKQLKKADFFDYSITGEFGKITKEAVIQFQKVAKLEADGVVGPETLKLLNEGKIKNPNPGTASTSPTGPSIGKVEMLDWWKSGSKFFSRGTVATITDVRTGKRWKEKRTGGTNHADCEPLTAADAATLKSVVGGSWTWNRRPVLVTINGKTSAASMNVMPHGYKRVTGNNFPGHHCIHFLNSRTHGGNRLDPAHQAAIREAYNSRK